MKKKFMCLIMMTLMLIGSTLTAQANDYKGSKDWAVEFDGNKMKSNFTSSEMSSDILSILPGDSITLQVALKNNDQRRTDWYMTNEVLQSLEDSSEAEGGAYTYKLTYIAPNGEEKVLYSSEMVGGEGAEDGLHQATAGLEDYFYLDRLDTGKVAQICLYVKLDGETQGNAYQDTLAKLRMNFAVERVYEGVVNETVTHTKVVVLTQAAKTGDHSPIVLLSVLALVSGLVLLVAALLVITRKNSKKGA